MALPGVNDTQTQITNLQNLLNNLPAGDPQFTQQRADLQSRLAQLKQQQASGGDTFVSSGNGSANSNGSTNNNGDTSIAGQLKAKLQSLVGLIGSGSGANPQQMAGTFASAAGQAGDVAAEASSAIANNPESLTQLTTVIVNANTLTNQFKEQAKYLVEEAKKDLEISKKQQEHAKPA